MKETPLVRSLRDHHAMVATLAAAALMLGVLLAHEAYGETVTTRRVEEHVRWTERAAYTYEVPVVRNATVWPIGTVLPMGQPVYYRTVSSHVHVNFTWQAEAAQMALAEATMQLHVRGEGRDGQLYWEIVEPLAHAAPSDATSGIRLGGAVDLDELAVLLTRATRDHPVGDGRLNVSVRTTVAYGVRAAGADDADTVTHTLPISIADPRFHLPPRAEATWERPHATRLTVLDAAPAGWSGVMGALGAQALLLLGAGTIGAAAWARLTDRTRGLDAAHVAFLREHARHEEWVTTAAGRVDTAAFPRAVVELPSLEALVRVAADARQRIILDGSTRVYYLALATTTYRYSAHAAHARRR